ncbi:MAG TPA: carboxypeptidase-like regulatory domain-containing protein [Pyrinomonadaceae bacterium]|nr:carboxypeptidase-like regulatory domain-containing protein [Pyrinomonadaceae bacterium]
MRSALRVLGTAAMLTLLCSGLVFSQAIQTGGITGVVTDQSGALVRGATVEIISESAGKSVRSITTEDDGRFTANLLSPGAYKLEITAANFKKAVIAGVAVRITETTRQDISLEAGRIEETVNVQATPTLINPENATTGQPLGAETLRSLPLASPNFLFLLSLSTGVTGEPTDVRSAGRGTADVTVNGQRTSNNSVSLQGINVNDFNLAHFDTVPLPNPNVLQEMKVATSLYDASQGSKGGGALGLVIKPGEKNFHWEAYWSHRNDVLNANEWFFNHDGKKRGRLLQNVFGGTISGPVPKLGGFWLFNYQGVRARNGIDPNGSSLRPTVPVFPTNPDGTTSAAQLAQAFGLTVAQIDPIAVNILNLKNTTFGGAYAIPRPGQSGCTVPSGGTFNCTISGIAPIKDNQYTISYDRSMRNGKDSISGRWFWDEGDVVKPYGTATGNPGSLSFPRTDTQWNRFLAITETHTFSSNKINELRLGYSRFLFANIPTDLINVSDIGAVRGNSSQFPGIYQFAITGLITLGTGVNDERGTVSNTYNIVDTFSWVRGKHSLRLGGEATQYQLNRFNNFAVRGSLTTGATSSGITPTPNPLTSCTLDTNECTAFQNFLRGRVTAIQSAFGDPARNFVATDFAGFIQDDFRFSQRLTFNVGVRWEGMSFGHDKLFRAGIFDPALAARGLNPFLIPEKVNLAGFKGTPGVSDCALQSCFDGNNFAPRVGFAWDIKGDQKTVLRAGYGLYFQRLSNQNILQNSLAAPFTVQPLSNTTTPAPFQLQNPFAGIPPPSIVATQYIPQATFFAGLFNANTGAISTNPADVNNRDFRPIFVNEAGQRCLNYASPNTSIGATNCSINLASFTSAPLNPYTPYTQQWNLTLQRELWKGWAAEIGYVGSHYVGGLGIWDPFLAGVATAANPITVRDINGVSYTITTSTVNNEELRHQIVGLSRKRGSRYSGNIGFATYNSFQATVSRRLSRGLYFQAAYTWSKTIDNVSGALSTDELNATRNGQGGANILNAQNNPRQNKAVGDFDRPNRFVVSYAYDLPVPSGSFWDNQFFRGWAISGIITYQSGLPFSVTDSTSGGAFGQTGGGTATLSGTCAGNGYYTHGSTQDRLNHYLNPACFRTAVLVPGGAAGATGFGNAPRNAFRGPSQQNWDFSVQKRFKLGESHEFQFRTDFFNLWNHPIFGFPSSVNIGTPATFAQVTSTVVPARLIQFGLSYRH